MPLWADPQLLMRTDLIGRLGSIDLPVRAHRLSERASRRDNPSEVRWHGLSSWEGVDQRVMCPPARPFDQIIKQLPDGGDRITRPGVAIGEVLEVADAPLEPMAVL